MAHKIRETLHPTSPPPHWLNKIGDNWLLVSCLNHELGFTLCGCNVLIESTKKTKLTYPWKFGRSSIQAPGVMRFDRAMFDSTHWARWKKYKKRVRYFTWHIMVDIWLVVIMLSVHYRKWCHYSTTSIYFHYNDTMFTLDIVRGSFFHFKKSLGSTFSTYRFNPNWYHAWWYLPEMDFAGAMDRSQRGEGQRWCRQAME